MGGARQDRTKIKEEKKENTNTVTRRPAPSNPVSQAKPHPQRQVREGQVGRYSLPDRRQRERESERASERERDLAAHKGASLAGSMVEAGSAVHCHSLPVGGSVGLLKLQAAVLSTPPRQPLITEKGMDMRGRGGRESTERDRGKQRKRASGTCLLRPSMLHTMSLEYGCSSTYLSRPVCGSNRSCRRHTCSQDGL